MSVVTDKRRDAAWLGEVIVGLLLGFVWSIAFLYLPLILGGMFPDPTSPFVQFLFRPGISIVFLILGLKVIRKERIVSGVLVVAILFNVWMALHWATRASYVVQLSGKSYASAAGEHFGRIWKGK